MRKYYEAYDDRYRQVHGKNLRWFTDMPSPIVGTVMESYAIDGRILEIGCGEGRDARELLEHGSDLLATDISREAIAYCRTKWPEYADRFQILDCIDGVLEETFDFIYALAVIHMLVCREDRDAFYRFIREHLKEKGYALICTMGDGILEQSSDISRAFDLQERVHEDSGRRLFVAGTSYRAISFPAFEEEISKNGLIITEQGITDETPGYWKMMYAVVRKS